MARRKHPGQLFLDRPAYYPGNEGSPKPRTQLPFRATITAAGRRYEVEVHELGMRFVRRLEGGDA